MAGLRIGSALVNRVLRTQSLSVSVLPSLAFGLCLIVIRLLLKLQISWPSKRHKERGFSSFSYGVTKYII